MFVFWLWKCLNEKVNSSNLALSLFRSSIFHAMINCLKIWCILAIRIIIIICISWSSDNLLSATRFLMLLIYFIYKSWDMEQHFIFDYLLVVFFPSCLLYNRQPSMKQKKWDVRSFNKCNYRGTMIILRNKTIKSMKFELYIQSEEHK